MVLGVVDGKRVGSLDGEEVESAIVGSSVGAEVGDVVGETVGRKVVPLTKLALSISI